MSKLSIILTPETRQRYIDDMLAKDGLSHISENSTAAYCPLSLTQTPVEVKAYVLERQNILMNEVLKPAGITAYDPSSAPFSPDRNLTSLPQEIYLVDSGKIVGARYFVGHNLTAATGVGVEFEKAVKFNRMAVILHDAKIRISRMLPHRVIYLQYHDFAQQTGEFVEVFKLLQQYEPGMGFAGSEPVLVGFHKVSGEVVNLEALVYEKFPSLKYVYDGQQPTLTLSAQNPELFREHNVKKLGK